jgi:prephenate dehydrogenase
MVKNEILFSTCRGKNILLRAGKTCTMRLMKVGIFGLGRFGTLWARLLSMKFPVMVYNRTPRSAPSDTIPLVDLETLGDCDVLFLCTAISSVEEVVRLVAPILKPGALVADTCSVKVYPVECMKRILPDHVSILGTHPMFGPDSARDGVEGLPLILCPVRVSREDYTYWRTVFLSYGMRVVEMTPDEHDREAAFTQGIAHFVGRVMKDLDLKPSEIGTLGYGKLLEIMEQTCNDPWQLFLDLQHFNPHTVEMRRLLRKSLKRILSQLES